MERFWSKESEAPLLSSPLCLLLQTLLTFGVGDWLAAQKIQLWDNKKKERDILYFQGGKGYHSKMVEITKAW